MSLEEYNKKRDFKKTSEPGGKKKSSKKNLMFVVQKHAARNLHYDFRLEMDGVLKSWAVPKGPSLDPKEKRLAMLVEDHPFDYKDFEGIIPDGNYGAGNVIVWDTGSYHALDSEDKKESEKLLKQGFEKGDLKFYLHGEKLNGGYALVNMKKGGNKHWLLIKKKDEFATEKDILKEDKSILTGKRVEEISEDEGVWQSNKKSSGKKKAVSLSPKINKSILKEASKKKMPHKIKPMLATLIEEPFDDSGWIFELKLDGYRAVAEIDKGKVELYSRKLNSFNNDYPEIVSSLKKIKNDVVLDGEIVVLDEKGKSKFQLIQKYKRFKEGNLVYYLFDILYLDGHDLRDLPLIKRKELLKSFLPDISNIRYSDHIEEHGKDFFKLAAENETEGIIAKDKNSPYRTGKRTKEWLKLKTKLQQEAIICGFTEPKGSRKNFGALILGMYSDGELIYIGHSGGGFTDDDLKDLYKKFQPLKRKKSPFKEKVKTNTPVTWIEPKLICEVTFSEWTEEGNMRHPVFLGLRKDKEPKEVSKEIPLEEKEEKEDENVVEKEITIEGVKLKLTNLNKIYWPDAGYTKKDLIDYYDSVADYILPYLKGRPESLNRHPNGIYGKSFFQKDMRDLPKDWMTTEKVYSGSNDKSINYLICNDKATLIYMANLGCIEINPWFSKIGSLDNPDYLVIDLDPEDISFDKVVEAALAVKEVLNKAGAESFCKTSGATGLHIYVPLAAKYNYAIAKEFAHVIGKFTHRLVPDFTSLERSPSKRKKKVYLDYLQNRSGQTLAAPYSVRPKPGATVAAPLKWNEVKIGLTPADFTIKNITKRLKKTGDIFSGVLGKGIDIEKCIKNLEK